MSSQSRKRQSSVMFAKGTKFHDKATAAGALPTSNSNGNADWGGLGGILNDGDDSDSESSDDDDGFRRNASGAGNRNRPTGSADNRSDPIQPSQSQFQPPKSAISKSSAMREQQQQQQNGNNAPRQSWGMRAAAVGDRPPDSASQNPQSLKLLGLKSAREGGTKYGGAASGLHGSRQNDAERNQNINHGRDRDERSAKGGNASPSSRPSNARQQIQPSPDFEMVQNESRNQNQSQPHSANHQGRAPVQKGYVDRLSRTINFNSNPRDDESNGTANLADNRRAREDSDGFGGIEDYSNGRSQSDFRDDGTNGARSGNGKLGVPSNGLGKDNNNRPVSPLTAVATELGLKTPQPSSSPNDFGGGNGPFGGGSSNHRSPNVNQRPNGPSREQSDYFGQGANNVNRSNGPQQYQQQPPLNNQSTPPFNPQRPGPNLQSSPNNRNGPHPPPNPMGPSPPQAALRNPSPLNPQNGPNNRGPPPPNGGRDGGFGYERPLLNNGGNGPSPPINAARGPPGGGMNGGNLSPTMRGGPGPGAPNGMGMRAPPVPGPSGPHGSQNMRPPPSPNHLGPNNPNQMNQRGPSPGPSFSDSQGPRPQQSVWRRSMAMFGGGGGGGGNQGPPNGNGNGNQQQPPRQNIWRRSMALLGGGGPQPPRPPPQRAPSEDELEEKPIRVKGFERELIDSKPTPRKSLYLGGGPSGMEWDYSGEGGNKFWRRFSMAQHHSKPNDKIEEASKAYRKKTERGSRRGKWAAAVGGMTLIGGIVGIVIWRENAESGAHTGDQPSSVDKPTGGLVSLNQRDVEPVTRIYERNIPKPSPGLQQRSWLDSFADDLIKERNPQQIDSRAQEKVSRNQSQSQSQSLEDVDDDLPDLTFSKSNAGIRRRHHEKLARRQNLASSSSSQ